MAFKLVDEQDETVEVNQRALIDKVLSRYSSEFTVFRELLQNSDDAQSPSVEIHFETAAYRLRKNGQRGTSSLSDLRSTHVTQWTFKNNGKPFREEDWSRLRKIAEGNPDEKKIGAFGVGFYSLFSVTENPVVSSGGYGMEFYWKDKKAQLNVRHGRLPKVKIADPWTTFEMVLREAGPMPHAFNLMRFIASSITFMVHLKEVRVYFNEYCIGHVQKSPEANAVNLPVPSKLSSQSKVMKVKGIKSQSIRIEATIMLPVNAVATEMNLLPESAEPSFAFGATGQLAPQSASPKAPTESRSMDVTLTVFTAEVDVNAGEKLSAEFLRSTKKNPPAQLKYHLVYTRKREYDQSQADDKNKPSIFQGLRADLDGSKHTRIFIGHASGQTTGIGGHMASHFIPTVERESIDFVDRNIAIWNKELLCVGGFLARVAYELELSTIDIAWTTATNGATRPPHELQHQLEEECFHTLKFFTFHHSTPSPDVSRLLEASFYGCSASPLRMLSSVGVREASYIKEYDPFIAKFLRNLPMLSQSAVGECGRIIETLQNKGMLSPVEFPDVLKFLRQRRLNMEEAVSCLQWWTALKQDSLATNVTQLLGAITISGVRGELLLMFVTHFADPQALGRYIPLDSPLPESLLPQDIARQFTPAELSSFGWQEFTIIDWLRHISKRNIMSGEHDFTKSSNWATRIIIALSHIWPSASSDDRYKAMELLSKYTCVPTSHGMCAPASSYLPGTNTGLFGDLDLPMVQFPNGLGITGDVEIFLVFLGVRKHADPQLILNRMYTTRNWNITSLVGYLVQVQECLTTEEVARLQSFRIFAKEGTVKDTTRYRAHELYAPTNTFRQLKLPVLHWDEKLDWSDDSDEGKLLFHLGLRDHPPLEKILVLCSSDDVKVRTTGFLYFCDNLVSKYSHCDPHTFKDIAFIPAENKNGKHLGKPGDVFTDKKWKILGFSVIQDDYRDAPSIELGIQQHPPTSILLSCLEKSPPSDENAARAWFETLFDRISSFEPPELVRLTNLPIVPVKAHSSGTQKWLAPTQCYVGEGTQDSFHSKLFDFVDFGAVANRFLNACGSRNEPSLKDVAESLASDPERFHGLSGGDENFLAQLRNLAVNKNRIPNLTLISMKNKSVLLGKKTIIRQNGDLCVHKLQSAKEIVIADDINSYHPFRDAVFIAPQEELLEDLYMYLGCKRLSHLIREHCEVGDEISDVEKCSKMRVLVLERLALFLHEYTHTKPKVPLASLFDPGNFQVRMCKTLSVSKTLVVGDAETVRCQEASAGTKCTEKGKIELWLAHNVEPDMYEISTSLCRLLFGTVKLSESLLFGTILSRDLGALRRSGCNVDLILKKCQSERENEHDLAEEEIPKSLISQAASESKHTQSTQNEPSRSCVSVFDPETKRCPSTASPTLANIFTFSLSLDTINDYASSVIMQHVIPLDIIQNNIDIAIKRCSPAQEHGHLIHNPSNVEATMDPLNDCYCHDVSEKADDLKFLHDFPIVVSSRDGKLRTVKVFATPDVPNLDTFMTSKTATLHRFVSIIVPIAEVHGLSATFLNIFYDVGGGSIAFNRNGSLFLNLRYFEAWHNQEVENGNQQRAQISWFFTLAHEIAHNLVKSHNSEHAFWFSAICEARIPALVQILESMASR